MSSDLIADLSHQRLQLLAVCEAHQLLDIELPRHLQLAEEKVRRERRMQRSGRLQPADIRPAEAGRYVLEAGQQIDRGAIEPGSLLAILVQHIEQRPVAGVELQHGEIACVQYL